MHSFISAILGGLIVGALFLCFMPVEADSLPTVQGDLPAEAPAVGTSHEPATNREPADVLADRELAELRARVRRLEAQASLPAGPTTERTILKDHTTPRLSARVGTLEAQVDALRQSSPIASFQPDCGDDSLRARSLIAAALSLSKRNEKGILGALNRIPLRLWLLERWPKHPSVQVQLWELVGECCDTLQYHKAIEAIGRYGPRAGLSSAQLDRMRLRAARTDLERVRLGRLLVQSEADSLTRAFDTLYLAECLARTRQYDEALRMLDSAMPAFANTKYAEHAAKRAKKLRESVAKTR